MDKKSRQRWTGQKETTLFKVLDEVEKTKKIRLAPVYLMTQNFKQNQRKYRENIINGTFTPIYLTNCKDRNPNSALTIPAFCRNFLLLHRSVYDEVGIKISDPMSIRNSLCGTPIESCRSVYRRAFFSNGIGVII